MSIDRFFIWLALAFLPLLWLPKIWLYPALLLIGGVGFWALFKRNWYFLLLASLMLISYGRVIHLVNTAENVGESKGEYQVEITKILKQQDYQTAIGALSDGRNIYLTWQTNVPLLLNRHYHMKLTIRPISARSNMGNFDRQRWYFANHINGLATVKNATLQDGEPQSFRTQWLEHIHSQIQHLPTKGLILALAFGERAWLPTDDWLLFQQTATAHLIAISGLHIGLAMWFGFWLAKGGQWLLLKMRKWQAVAFSYLFPRLSGLFFACTYSYLAGFSAPTLRALLAITLVLICQFGRRHYTPLQLWWRIVPILLVLEPVAILSDSFWLSILAVLGLILWYRYFPLAKFRWLPFTQSNNRFIRGVISLIHLQIGIGLLFSPVQFFFFEGNSPFSLLANLLVVPLYSFFIVPTILFTLLTDNLFHSWAIVNALLQLGLQLLKPLSHAWFSLSYWQQWLILMLNAVILLLLDWKNQGQLRYKMLICFCAFNLAYYAFLKHSPKAEWIMFDVGQGLAQALIYEETSGQKKAIFYDTGSSWGEGKQKNSMAKLEILPYLQRNAIEVEAIFLSHDDNDHSGGVADLLSAFPNAQLFSAGQQHYQEKTPQPCIAGQQWQYGEFHLSAVYPFSQTARAKNQDSCILLVKINRFKGVLTGDTGSEQEKLFAKQLGNVDLLQIAHHGSKTSTTALLLETLRPKMAIVSSGRWNPWKMPNKTVVARLAERQIPLLNTAKTGMIRIQFEAEQWQIATARHHYSPWYRSYF